MSAGATSQKVGLTIEDYKNPTQDFLLPPLPEEVVKQLGVENKNVLLKKNIIEKNKSHHKDLSLDEYNDILSRGLYSPSLVLKTNPKESPNYFNFIFEGTDKNDNVVVEISAEKENAEIVSFYLIDKEKLDKKIKRTDRNGGLSVKTLTRGPSPIRTPSVGSLDSIANNEQIFKAANRVRREVISEIEKRQLAGKEEMLRFLKLAKTSEEIRQAVAGVLEQVEKAYEKTEEGKQEKRQLEVPATDWEKKRVELLAQFNEIIRQTEESVA